jgi:hypothetical protein
LDKKKEEIARGNRANRWLNDDEIKAAWNEMSRDIKIEWASSSPDQEEYRERLYYQYRCLDELRQRMEKIISKGKRAELEVNRHGSHSK